MIMMGIGPWKRARSPEQKAERERAILDAAAELVFDKGFDATSMRAIGCKARLSKGNLYRYFKSKEELFLRLYLEDFNAWFDAMEAGLVDRAGEQDLPWLADLVTRTLLAQPRMGRLTALLTGVLEHNVPTEALVAFKEEIVGRAMRLARAISGAVPALSEEQSIQFIRMVHFFVAGVWPTSTPSEAMQRAVEASELLQRFHVAFEDELAAGIQTVLAGVAAPAQSSDQ